MAWWMPAERHPFELRAAVQQHLHQPHHAGVVNLDAGDFGFAGHDRQCHAKVSIGRPSDVWLDTKIIDRGDRWNHPPTSLSTGMPLLGFSRAQPLAMVRQLS
jgi:hypothetical protein